MWMTNCENRIKIVKLYKDLWANMMVESNRHNACIFALINFCILGNRNYKSYAIFFSFFWGGGGGEVLSETS